MERRKKMGKKSFKKEIKKMETPAGNLLFKAKVKSKRQKKQKDFETKSARLNLLLRPSIKKSIGKLATLERISTNELINRVLEKYTKLNLKNIDRYDKFYKEK